MCDVHPLVVGDDVVVDGEDRLRVRLDPGHLPNTVFGYYGVTYKRQCIVIHIFVHYFHTTEHK